jgi:polar amino acid transport system substrate-binding protein
MEKEDIMNRKLVSIFFIVITIAVLTSGQGSSPVLAGDQPTFIQGIDPAYPPFTFVDKKGKASGFDIDMIAWIAKEEGFTVKIKPLKWESIIPALQAGEIDFIASGMSATPDRMKVIDFSNIYWRSMAPIIASEDYRGDLFSSLFSGGTIAVQRGSANGEWFAQQLKKNSKFDLKLDWYDTFPLAVQAVLVNRADLAFCSAMATGREVIQGKPLKIIGATVWGSGYGIGVRKEDKELKKKLNKGLKKIKASPVWDELVTKYHLE